MNMNLINDIPYELLNDVIMKLSLNNIINLSLTCKLFYRLTNDNYLWKYKLRKDFNLTCLTGRSHNIDEEFSTSLTTITSTLQNIFYNDKLLHISVIGNKNKNKIWTGSHDVYNYIYDEIFLYNNKYSLLKSHKYKQLYVDTICICYKCLISIIKITVMCKILPNYFEHIVLLFVQENPNLIYNLYFKTDPSKYINCNKILIEILNNYAENLLLYEQLIEWYQIWNVGKKHLYLFSRY